MKGRNVQHILKRLASSAALCALIASVSTRAQAQAEDQAAARQLFEDGRRLLKNGQYQRGVPKLQAASRLYASPGILLNLGDCYEKIGRTASAWTEFGEAAAAAGACIATIRSAKPERRQAAARAEAHAACYPRLQARWPGLAITRDDSEVASAALGEAIPVDPGTHQVRAEAPGYESWSTSVVASDARADDHGRRARADRNTCAAPTAARGREHCRRARRARGVRDNAPGDANRTPSTGPWSAVEPSWGSRGCALGPRGEPRARGQLQLHLGAAHVPTACHGEMRLQIGIDALLRRTRRRDRGGATATAGVLLMTVG